MNRSSKVSIFVVVSAGIIATFIYSGTLLTAWPFAIFVVAGMMGRSNKSGYCTLALLLFAIFFGTKGYYDEFWTGHSSDISGLAFLVLPIMQAFIGLIAVLLANEMRPRKAQ